MSSEPAWGDLEDFTPDEPDPFHEFDPRDDYPDWRQR